VSSDYRLGRRPEGVPAGAESASARRRESPYHHGSHRALLRLVPGVLGPGVELDAVVVPTVRPAESLRAAAALATALGCPLVVFCSGGTRAEDVVTTLAGGTGPRLLAIDVPNVDDHPLLGFTTSSIHRAQTDGRVDTGPKRNLGLLLARVTGWEHILFLDDDVTVEKARDVRQAARLLDRYDSVGLSVGGFPDNSVVCHAHRIGDGWQDTFVGGGALAVKVPAALSFFPEVYNEDWFFLLAFFLLRSRRRPVAVTGRAVQREYDPFAHTERARYEEFGDVLAEGVFWLLDQNQAAETATEGFWSWFLGQRELFIEDVARRIRRSRELDRERRRRILVALDAAQQQRRMISASQCVEYLRAWTADRSRWLNVLAALPSEPDPVKAAHLLGLRARTGDSAAGIGWALAAAGG
jgi:hypothetical protein